MSRVFDHQRILRGTTLVRWRHRDSFVLVAE
jgi:hypothetical protein